MTAPNHVRAWREHRGMTQAQVAALIGTNASMVSLLEAGQRRLSPMWLRRLATALNAPVGAFMEYAPDQGRADVLDLWAAVPESSRPIALEIMRGFVANGSRPAECAEAHSSLQVEPTSPAII